MFDCEKNSCSFKRKFKLFVFIIFVLTCLFGFAGCLHEHQWISATCHSPKTCEECGLTVGSEKEHNWISATCESPKRCLDCGQTVGYKAEHSWMGGNKTTPKHCRWCDELGPFSLPQSGTVFIGEDLYRNSELTIKSSTYDSCYIKLKGTSGKDVFSFFVRAGDQITVKVPAGNFYVYFSYGTDWYGTDKLFGEETTYAKDDELLNFKKYTWEYTLMPMIGGNFTETKIDAEEFK